MDPRRHPSPTPPTHAGKVSYLIHPSGGLVYHARALRHGRSLWLPYQRALATWLVGWRPAGESLLLLGPSGGYALDTGFLDRFQRVSVVEPDPLARLILSRRFPRVRFQWLPPGKHLLDPVHTCSGDVVLFCNLLGQDWLGPARPEDRQEILAGLPHELAGRTWASFHDVISTSRLPATAGPIRVDDSDLATLLGRFWPAGELELADHGTWTLGAGRPTGYVVWNLAPGHHHLVAWVTGQS